MHGVRSSAWCDDERTLLMAAFRCIPIETETAERFRRTHMDDNGNAVRHAIAVGSGNFPCRHCLRPAMAGETVLLGSYNLPRPRGIYWTPSPIFVHAEACERFDIDGEVAPVVRSNSLISIRAYDAADQCIYDLGSVCAANEIDRPLALALDDVRTAFINIHTARPGCLLCRVERLD